MINSKDLNYNFTSGRINTLWSTYRLRYMNEPDRGYWDEYTDVMKDSYGIGIRFYGLFRLHEQDAGYRPLGVSPIALEYRQPQTLVRIYMMLGESYLALGDPGGASAITKRPLKQDPRNPYVYAKIGDAFLMMKNIPEAGGIGF